MFQIETNKFQLLFCNLLPGITKLRGLSTSHFVNFELIKVIYIISAMMGDIKEAIEGPRNQNL